LENGKAWLGLWSRTIVCCKIHSIDHKRQCISGHIGVLGERAYMSGHGSHAGVHDSNPLCKDFFDGRIKDKTTKESRKAAESLSMLRNQMRNPNKCLLDGKVLAPSPLRRSLLFAPDLSCLIIIDVFPCAQGRKASVKSVDVVKAKVLVAGTLPPSVMQKMSDALLNDGFDGDHVPAVMNRKRHGPAWQDPLEQDVSRDIQRRIDILGKSGHAFEEGMPYAEYNERDVVDAEHIVRGIDPATLGAHAAGRFVARRKINVERRHWLACKVGHYMTPYGVAYVHADGSIAIFRHGQAAECRCGAVHIC
jgi:hypothetical protein